MPLISQASIQEVKDRMDAVAVAADYAQLEKRGGRWWACCPFHQEKTPSFTVDPDRKSYYCFGCHKGDTIINLVMEMDKLSFPEAIEQLAKRFGVELAYDNSGGSYSAEDEAKKKEKEDLFELYRRISGTFHHFLLENADFEDAKLYILLRNVNIEMIKKFRLGYAPPDRLWLHRFLAKKGYSREFLAASGLFSSQYPEISLFSGRLMFPIADRQGRVAAFGGRHLPGKEPPRDGREPPKYINSPESAIYKKRDTLFAADLAFPEIRRTKTAYLAEGYMDVIALHQAGIANAVAPLGTSFTDEQAKLLARWAERAVLFFDSDGAGQSAAIKAIFACRKNGLACALVAPGWEGLDAKNGADFSREFADAADNSNHAAIENSKEAAAKEPAAETRFEAPPKDPADILKNFGPEALQKKAKCIINDFDYLIGRARSLSGGSVSGEVSVLGKAKAVAFLFPYMDLLDSEVAMDSCIDAAADAFRLLPAAVREDYRRYTADRKRESPARIPSPKEEALSRQPGRTGSPIRLNDELSLLIAVAADYVFPRKEKLYPQFRAALEIDEIEDPYAKELFIALEECSRHGETGMDEFLARVFSPELKAFFLERNASGEFSLNPERYVADGINAMRRKRLERRNTEIIVKLRALKKSSPDAERSSEANELLAEKMQIDNELYRLKQGS